MLGHPGVAETAVIAREDQPGVRRLVGLCGARGRGAGGSAGLRSWLKRRSAGVHGPVGFVLLDRLPLTVSGKLDRRALPAPDVRVEQKAFVAPRTGAERVLAGIWAELLGADRVGAEDNFFELGGDSIL